MTGKTVKNNAIYTFNYFIFIIIIFNNKGIFSWNFCRIWVTSLLRYRKRVSSRWRRIRNIWRFLLEIRISFPNFTLYRKNNRINLYIQSQHAPIFPIKRPRNQSNRISPIRLPRTLYSIRTLSPENRSKEIKICKRILG